MVQGVKNLTAVTQVMGSIPSLVQWVKGSGIGAAVSWVTAAAQIQSLAWEIPYAAGAAIKKKEREKKKAPECEIYFVDRIWQTC